MRPSFILPLDMDMPDQRTLTLSPSDFTDDELAPFSDMCDLQRTTSIMMYLSASAVSTVEIITDIFKGDPSLTDA